MPKAIKINDHYYHVISKGKTENIWMVKCLGAGQGISIQNIIFSKEYAGRKFRILLEEIKQEPKKREGDTMIKGASAQKFDEDVHEMMREIFKDHEKDLNQL